MRTKETNSLVVSENIKDEKMDVYHYLKEVTKIVEKHREDNQIFVYRGEPEEYTPPCQPNIFRRDYLHQNPLFEKNLFDTMRQSFISNDHSYLDNAIDAQHGEFPSRLLDVSYNCLIGLYFAVTPFYHHAENSLDHKDGMVYVFFLDEIYSPSAENTRANYDAIIKRDLKWFTNSIIFEKNLKFIDHTKLNKRIVAQQGAFILFQGDSPSVVPRHMVESIKIPSEHKKKIREQLRLLFGIHTGSVYPEIVNLADELSKKSMKICSSDFSIETELVKILETLRKELDFHIYSIYRLNASSSEINEIALRAEKYIWSLRTGFITLHDDMHRFDYYDDNARSTVQKSIEQFNQIVIEYGEKILKFSLYECIVEELLIK